MKLDQLSNKVKIAKEFATIKHQGQTRKDNTPYIYHPIRVAQNVINYVKNHNCENLVISALLHDTLEDTNTTYEEINSLFGVEVASIVQEVTNDDNLKHKYGKEKYLIMKLNNISNDALIVKLCDRLDNIIDLKNSNDLKFIEKYLMETSGIIDSLLNNRELLDIHLLIMKDIVLESLTYCKEKMNFYINISNLLTKIEIYKMNKTYTLEKK